MDKQPPTVRSLYPDLNAEQLREAEDNLEQYLLLVLRIYERIRSDPKSYTRFRRLTENTGGVPSGTRSGSIPVPPDNLPIQT